MSREEAEATSSIATDSIDEIHQQRILRRSPSSHHWLHQSRADSICHNNQNNHGEDYHERFLWGIVLEDDNQQGDDNHTPGERVRDCVHHIVPKHAVASIERKGQLLVKF